MVGRPIAGLAGLEAFSWLFGWDKLIQHFARHNILLTICIIIVLTVTYHVVLDKHVQQKEVEYKQAIDNLTENVAKIQDLSDS